MQLCFRGIHYNRPQSYIEYSEGEICGKYRGNPWKSHHHKLLSTYLLTFQFQKAPKSLKNMFEVGNDQCL